MTARAAALDEFVFCCQPVCDGLCSCVIPDTRSEDTVSVCVRGAKDACACMSQDGARLHSVSQTKDAAAAELAVRPGGSGVSPPPPSDPSQRPSAFPPPPRRAVSKPARTRAAARCGPSEGGANGQHRPLFVIGRAEWWKANGGRCACWREGKPIRRVDLAAAGGFDFV